LDCFDKALQLVHGAFPAEDESDALTGLGDANDHLGNKEKAIQWYEKAMQFQKASAFIDREADTSGKLGKVYYETRQFDKSLKSYQDEVQICTSLDGEEAGLGKGLLGVAKAYVGLNQKQNAVDTFAKARPYLSGSELVEAKAITHNLLIELGPKVRGRYLYQIGKEFSEVQRTDDALTYLTQALPLCSGVDKGLTLNVLGQVYGNRFEREKALGYFKQALLIFEKANDEAGQLDVLNKIVGTSDELHRKDDVQKYLAQMRKIGPLPSTKN
jgi:tetratricopeptide (TPR) repeat protein